MNDLKIFENKEFGEIRTVVKDGEPWFVGKDVAEILGHSNPQRALRDYIDDDDKGVTKIVTPGGTQTMAIINESGLYSLILSSKLPNAKKFKKWVTSEVLPSIRKNGGYIAGQETMSDDELMARALQVAQNKILERDKQIETMKPKAIFADAVAASHTSILIGDIKREGSDRNMPTQRSMEMKLFEVKESTISNPDGSVRITRTPKVTGKGQQYFVNKFLTE